MTNCEYNASILPEQLRELPLVRFGGHIEVVESEERQREVCEKLLGTTMLGFDTETKPKFTPGPAHRTALIQLSTPDECFLFRICRMKIERPLICLLESERVKKIGADIPCDLLSLGSILKFRGRGFIDLQKEAEKWGITDKSLRKLAGIVLGGKLSKAQRLSNWEASALTPAQQMYAATDAWVCLEIYNRLLKTKQIWNDRK